VIPQAEAQVVVPKSAATGKKIIFTATVTVDDDPNVSAASAHAVVIVAKPRHWR
jgi:hypothetical protein